MIIEPQGYILSHERVSAAADQEVAFFLLYLDTFPFDRRSILGKLPIQKDTLGRVKLLGIGRKRQSDKNQ
jgi:hypothetical protein